MYNILVIHGLTVFVLMMYMMYGRWGRIRRGIAGRRTAVCALAAVFAVCIESFFDVDLIWTNYSLNMFFLLFVMNTGYEKEAADERRA